jgi:serine/threonine protein kinase
MLKVPEATYAGIREGGSATWKIEEPRMKIVRELGKNISGGRITYLAKDDDRDRQVVLKTFQFVNGNWDGFKAIEREVEILRSLHHPRIPKYLDSFQSDEGFCLVQEYIPAESLAGGRSLTTDQIQEVARQTLEILVYLQSLHPPVLHRDIKPENLLFNGEKVYLVDFGLSRFGGKNVALSSVMAGTLGYMAPELFAGREPTVAADIYGLGATLICIASAKSSAKLNELMGEDFSFLPSAFENLPKPFATWLKRVVAAKLSDRFADAAEALEKLEFLDKEKATELEIEPEMPYSTITKLDFEIGNAQWQLEKSPFNIKARIRLNKAIKAKEDFLFGKEDLENSIAPQESFWLKPWHLYAAYLGLLTALCVVFSGITSSNPQLIQPVLEWLRSGVASSTHTTNEIR